MEGGIDARLGIVEYQRRQIGEEQQREGVCGKEPADCILDNPDSQQVDCEQHPQNRYGGERQGPLSRGGDAEPIDNVEIRHREQQKEYIVAEEKPLAPLGRDAHAEVEQKYGADDELQVEIPA